MAYTKTNWQALPSTTTPINPTNLNNIENGIKTNDDKLLGNTAMGDILPASVTTTGNVTVGGTLNTSNSGRVDYAADGYTYDGSGNMQHKRNNNSDTFYIKSNAGNPTVAINPEYGDLNVSRNLGIGGHILVKNPPTTDIDSAEENATYMYDNGSNTYTHAPTTDGIHILNVFNNGSGDWVVQEDYVLRWGASTVDKYIRLKTASGQWGNWQRII